MPNRRALIRARNYVVSLGRPGPDLSWITDLLAVSGTVRPRHLPLLVSENVKAIVDLREEARNDPALLAEHGIQSLYLPVRDHFSPAQEQLEMGSEWVLAQLRASRRTVVHCKEGIGRSVVLSGCVLMRMGYDLAGAVAFLKSRRWGVALNARQMAGLEEFQRGLPREAVARGMGQKAQQPQSEWSQALEQ